MTRKLFSLALSGFALLLLMGAGVEEDPNAELIPEDAALQNLESHQAPVQLEPIPATAGTSVLTMVEDRDRGLTVNGQPVPTEVSRTQRNGTTYVALVPMAKCLNPAITAAWNEGSKTAGVYSAGVNLAATVGQRYLIANDRYLYVPEGVQMVDGQVVVPLSVLVEAFGASLTWDSAAGVAEVTLGSGGIRPGNQFYNENDLFWMSRVIHMESGNQPLEGRIAVGNVILNRVKSPIFPNSIQEVLAQKNQFTTYQSGKLANCTPSEGSVIAAKLVLDGAVVEETHNAMYFDSTPNSWAAKNRPCIAVIGGHRFYA